MSHIHLILFPSFLTDGHTETTHPMDCTDIVIGMARGKTSRINDYYTRDRATPRMDSFYGGEDSLTAAVGMEDESTGMTYLKFRRPLDTGRVGEREGEGGRERERKRGARVYMRVRKERKRELEREKEEGGWKEI